MLKKIRLMLTTYLSSSERIEGHHYAWGSCSSGVWGLISFCRPKFDSLCVLLSPPRCLPSSLGLQGFQWAVGNSHGARKLVRTPHVHKKKTKKNRRASLHPWTTANPFQCPHLLTHFMSSSRLKRWARLSLLFSILLKVGRMNWIISTKG
jgi:hypothetical protein